MGCIIVHGEEILETSKILGNDFAQMYVLVKNDLFQLRVKWRVYNSFFGANSETVDLLNSVSGTTAQILEITLFENVLLALRRITDKPNSRGKKKSVTVCALPSFLPVDEEIELKILVGKTLKLCGAARDWSDKKIAHSDLGYRSGAKGLLPTNRKQITDAIDAVADVVKWIASKKLDTTLVTHVTPPAHDKAWFLKHLYEGKQAFDKKTHLSKSYSMSGEYSKRNELYDFPDWLTRKEPPLDI